MDNYLGEIRIFAGNFAPQGWQFCNGQLLSISEYDALFALLGTTYGGDGQTTFALPSLQSRAVVGLGQGQGQGQGQGLSSYAQGQAAGLESVPLTAAQLPVHQHPVQASLQAHTGAPSQDSPQGAYFGSQGGSVYAPNNGSTRLATNSLVGGQVGPAGGGQPHTNLQPLLAIYYIIATEGIYPSPQ